MKFTLNQNKKPHIKYIDLAKQIIDNARQFYVSHKNLVNAGGKIISKQ